MFRMKKPPNGWQPGASELPFGKQSTPIINMKVIFSDFTENCVDELK